MNSFQCNLSWLSPLSNNLCWFAACSHQRRCAYILCLAIFAALTATTAAADYPDRPVRFIVPSASGGGPDVINRIIAGELTRQLGKQFVVDNRPGASGVIGTEIIARAAPDGYTIGNGNSGTLVLNRLLLPRLPYDVDRDIQPVAQHVVTPSILAVAMSLPVKSVQQLIEHARKNPGKLLSGVTGVGSTGHLGNELFKRMTGTQMESVYYKGSQQAITEMIGGQVHLMIDLVSAIGTHVKAGRVRGLAITSTKRSPAYPELPTIAESGLPGYEIVAWGGVVAPAGTAKSIVTRLNIEVNKALASTTVKEKIDVLGNVVVSGSPEDFADYIKREMVKWSALIKSANIKVN